MALGVHNRRWAIWMVHRRRLLTLTASAFVAPAVMRNQAMAGAIARVVPADTVAFAKGGSIDWEGFHCLCVPGQMIVSKVPVTFCMTLNWTGPAEGVPAMTKSYLMAVADVLREASAAVG
jgi:beta-lactamase class A